jgi:hypothetical protein
MGARIPHGISFLSIHFDAITPQFMLLHDDKRVLYVQTENMMMGLP